MLGAFALQLEGGKVDERADRLWRHGGDAQARAPRRGGARRASPGTRRRSRPRCAALARGLHADHRLARRAPPTALQVGAQPAAAAAASRPRTTSDRDPSGRRPEPRPCLSRRSPSRSRAACSSRSATTAPGSTSAARRAYIDDLPEPRGPRCTSISASAPGRMREITQHRPRAGARGAGRRAGADRRRHPGRQRRQPDASPRRAGVRDHGGRVRRASRCSRSRREPATQARRAAQLARGRVSRTCRPCSTSRRRGRAASS